MSWCFLDHMWTCTLERHVSTLAIACDCFVVMEFGYLNTKLGTRYVINCLLNQCWDLPKNHEIV